MFCEVLASIAQGFPAEHKRMRGDPHPYDYDVTCLDNKANITATKSQYNVIVR